MQKVIPEKDKRREKVVILFTRDEIARLNAYVSSRKVVSRSYLFRRIMFKAVERWESSVLKKANQTSNGQ